MYIIAMVSYTRHVPGPSALRTELKRLCKVIVLCVFSGHKICENETKRFKSLAMRFSTAFGGVFM